MISRPFWLQRIEQCWRKAPIVWLSGVRRAGKTTLAAELADALYLNCDLPSVQQLLADPEAFYRSVTRSRLVLDEVHQLPDPSSLLKIGADAFLGSRFWPQGRPHWRPRGNSGTASPAGSATSIWFRCGMTS